MVKKFLNKNAKAFWKEVKSVHNSKPTLPPTVDGVTGTNMIADLWRQHYCNLFNCVPSDIVFVDNVDHVETIQTQDVYQAISKMSDNKSTGLDQISNLRVVGWLRFWPYVLQHL